MLLFMVAVWLPIMTAAAAKVGDEIARHLLAQTLSEGLEGN